MSGLQTSPRDAAGAMPRWVAPVLSFAAIYNIVWGLFIVLFPLTPFRLAGMEPPNYPAIVQCLGMVIGIYGVGYAMAARDPVTLWPLVLLGLLGKVLGPVGFLYAASIGEFPWRAGLMIVTNDLIWWAPFIGILFQAMRVRDAREAHRQQLSLADVLAEAKNQQGQSLLDLSRQQELLLVCLRHFGCTYCREALHDLAEQRPRIEASGARPVIVHMGSIEQGEQMLTQYGCAGLDQVSDPDRKVYRALDLKLGTFAELFGILAFWRALGQGTIFRFGFGRMIGNPLQMPGAFVIRNGQIVKAYRHRFSGDRPDYAELSCSLS